MAIGLDYTQRIDPSALKSAGVTVVCRYIAPQAWKVIRKTEYDELIRNGFTVFLNWESAASDWNDGAVGGRDDGLRAVLMAKALSYPAGSIIIGSADFDHKNLETVRSYGVAFKKAIEDGGYRAGVYGPWDVLEVCKKIGFSFYWQCMSRAFSSWRNANLHPSTNLWQKGYKNVGGVQADWNQIINLPSAGTGTGGSGVPDVNLSDIITIPDYDHDPTLPENQQLSVEVALGVAAQRSYQALRAAQALATDVTAIKAALQEITESNSHPPVVVPEIDYDRLADLVIAKLGALKFVAQEGTV